MSRPAIAVVGMAGRFPGAASVAEFWQSLLRGEEQVRDVAPPAGSDPATNAGAGHGPRFVARAADLDDIDRFDAVFFGMTPQEAQLMDPQHRVLLQCAFEACEDAGLVPGDLGGRVGVYASGSLSSYLIKNLLQNSAVARTLDYQALIGNDKDFLATRISYKLNLTGPSVSVQSACSSSLVAVHLACRALADGDCDAALAGGVSITVPQGVGYTYKEGGILSRGGRCRVFDEDSSGTVKGNGCGVVVLKRLEDAQRAGDQIYAVIRGTAVGNDGAARAGFTAPSPAGQAATISSALAAAELSVADLGYVEAHGTGTSLGDPIELRALTRAHQATGELPRCCYLGSVKANIGHLDAAAGVVGLIKTALVLRHNTVPPQINFRALNPAIVLDTSRYRIPTELTHPTPALQVAAVSSFGLGGTNAHCLLAAPPASAVDGERAPHDGPYVLGLSARTAEALRALAGRLSQAMREQPALSLRDVAFTLQTGRIRLPRRWACLAQDRAQAIEQLARFAAGDQEPAAAPAPAAIAWIEAPISTPEMGDFRGAQRVSLPSYPFARERHWVEPDPRVTLAVAPGARAEATGPTVEAIIAILEEKLNVTAIKADDDYYALGGDSLAAVDVVTEIAERFGITIALSTFESLRTAAAIAGHLASAGRRPVAPANHNAQAPEVGAAAPAVSAAPAIAAPRAELVRAGQGAPIFLFPPAGGTNFCYYHLVRKLRSPRPFYVVPFPVDDRERIPSLRALAERFRRSVQEVQPVGPYTLAGYSFGGNVAFEVALQLQRAGETVPEITMFDAHPPEAYVGERISDHDVLAAFPLLLSSLFGASRAPSFNGSDPVRSIDDVLAGTDLAGPTVAVLGEYRRFFEVWRHNHRALKGYYPDERLQGRLTIFEAEEREDRRVLDLLRIRPLDKTPWRDHVQGEVRMAPVPGDHYSMFVKPENLNALAATWDLVLAGGDSPALWSESASPGQRQLG